MNSFGLKDLHPGARPADKPHSPASATVTPTIRKDIMIRKPALRLIAVASAATALVAGCSSGGTKSNAGGASTSPAAAQSSAAQSSPAVASSTASLASVCPSNINVQVNWWPSNDDAFLFQLIGPNGKIDAAKNTYSGPIGTTGVSLTIKSGGPAASYQTDTALAYENDDTYLTMESTDEQIANSAKQPTTAVFAWYQQYPVVFLWGNPAWNFKSIQDIAASNTKVLAFSSGTYLGVFEKEGLLKKSQVDTSYNGSPARFVAANGNIVQQGYVDEEPYAYAHDVPGWNKPVKFVQITQADYPVYQDNIAVRSDKLAAETPCLKQLVPLFQQASVDFAKAPATANSTIVKFTGSLKGTGATVSADAATFASQAQLQYGLVANGHDGTYGSFDTSILQSAIDKIGPVLAAEGKTPKAGLTPADLATNQFLDTGISLSK
jgi:hypothetical protein